MRNSGACSVLLALTAVASAQAGVVQFLTTDGNRLHRADSNGVIEAPVTLSAGVQSLTTVPFGFSMPGASGGDVIACAIGGSGGQFPVYRMDNPLGAATLVQIGSTSVAIGSLTFANGELYGVNASLSPIRIYRLDPITFATLQSWSTGVSVAGGGGLAYDPIGARFLLTDATNHRLMSWTPGNNATAIGPVGFGFANNGLEFHEGQLYGSLRPDSPATQLRVGTFDLSTGAFSTLVTITGISGDGTGFVTIPAPAAALVLLGAAAARRRRAV